MLYYCAPLSRAPCFYLLDASSVSRLAAVGGSGSRKSTMANSAHVRLPMPQSGTKTNSAAAAEGTSVRLLLAVASRQLTSHWLKLSGVPVVSNVMLTERSCF